MDKTELELNASLCNFCNSANDPFPPASEWDDEVYRQLKRLSVAYNEWYKWHKSRGNDLFHANGP